ncbi:G-protein coupled receptors family 1 profile domain-containing protein [Caenorhabditis elegans]|uniref:G-protein coupled receptors family 1 profile domain-containing protein n=1 Tax=Caenorhabditis elegans TaxID=6239 RepID=F1LIM4_CAEEL|nr:G-protein coupled receptors family 1 profile domain-containing protein [Caenorhabditis elegans]CCD62091.2 G-protein coupled receptors family 1 profile domain-containing protein [Caenorhabditis elegans]|eukprot:NP_001346703.1 Uncharacterized protein CELE_ZC196.9 [Caenorhabditis elegans]
MEKRLEGPMRELLLDISDSEKNWLYYSVVSLFVVSTIGATILTMSFLVLSILLWRHFKSMRFFWFLTQLTTSAFVISAANLFINIPAALSLFSKEVTQSRMFYFVSYIIDFCHYSILFSNLVIAVQRAFVFFLRNLTDRFFESKVIYIWISSIYIFAFGVEYALMFSNCQYRFGELARKYQLICETTNYANVVITMTTPTEVQLMETMLQIFLPLSILIIYIAITVKIIYMKGSTLSKNETLILKQAIFVFLIFQASSCVFLFAQSVQITNVGAFLVKRFVNTMEILAGAATPSFFFFTSKEIRKLVSTRVSAVSSQGPSNIQVRAARTLE